MKRTPIVGAAIAGPTTAVALRRAGWQPAVYEARTESAGDEAGAL
jgi:2-polyprenyl-6-methoxyphenol hydroxylase-like FAD-dependent oxidoreductase